MNTNALENNPFFLIDTDRFGTRFALREWLTKTELLGRDYLTKPLDACLECSGSIWASVTRPPLCYECYCWETYGIRYN